ncbi:MAG TPA: hypothetical protein VF159_06040 [Gemmatimonadaceae bacterium]
MTKRSRTPSVWESAARGAAAGLIGGAALSTAHRYLLPKLPDRGRKRRNEWDGRVHDVAEQFGWDLSPRTGAVVGVTTQLAAATLFGALYAVVTEQMQPSRAGKNFLDAGLVFAASMLAPELERKRRLPRGKRAKMRHRALAPITAPAVFGRTTALALKALTR